MILNNWKKPTGSKKSAVVYRIDPVFVKEKSRSKRAVTVQSG